MERCFEKVSFKEFKKTISDDKALYDSFHLPKRGTESSAGYDFFAIKRIVINPGEIVKIPTGIRAKFKSDEVLLIVVRSSMGFKYNVRLTNQVGVIDSDYYNSDNEGHIYVALQNEGDKDFIVEEGSAFAQGIFMKYLKTDDDATLTKRNGGLGSTNKKGNDKNE